ncbi:MAG TPA: AcrB/AcrD/AcrF family protein, partial [Desulfobacterales bacterium]|nr:AcrB/AcrD/AcrF family protein [Desulfobacterales bacterium]
KTYALIASIIVALTIIPSLAHLLFTVKGHRDKKASLVRWLSYLTLMAFGGLLAFKTTWWIGAIVFFVGAYYLIRPWLPEWFRRVISYGANWIVVLLVGLVLTEHWLPLGPERGVVKNFIFVAVVIGGFLAFFHIFQRLYRPSLRFCLRHKALFLVLPLLMILWGGLIWFGFNPLFRWLPESIQKTRVFSSLKRQFPGLGKEFMPPLDEGSFLFMPTTMPHASIGEALDVLQNQDKAMGMVPEIESAVGKLGRVDSPLDPAPISMIETVINYKPEYLVDRNGRRLRFRFVPDETDYFSDEYGNPVLAPDGKPYTVQGRFERDKNGRLIPDSKGTPFRLWRPPLDADLNSDRDPWPGIRNPDDIWSEILRMTEIPGTTSAPKLQPIVARIVMLQSGMRAPMGVKIKGPDLETIERVGFQIERYLKEVPSIEPATVVADRIVGKPYLEIEIDRRAIARYGIKLKQVQNVIEVAIGGKRITTTVQGRERYPVRVRYLRELRDNIESLGKILVPAPDGTQIPLIQVADISYVRGPQAIKSEDTFLIGYVILDKKPGHAEVDVVEQAQAYLLQKMKSGEWELPAGVSYTFSGSYENQIRAQKTLSVILPLALFIIFMILYFQFRSVLTTLMVFSGILVAWAGGFILIWLYSKPWFLDFTMFDVSMQALFQVHPINLSVAIWVGFLALFGIASDNGVLVATFLDKSFASGRVSTIQEAREATMAGALRRIRPAVMTSATTILALIPVLTSTGRGADVMVPMAIPSFGGMLMAVITVFVVPVLYCGRELTVSFD